MSSFLSVLKHPFEKHEKVYHELTVSQLESIYNELLAIKEKAESKRVKNLEKKKKTKNSKRPAVTYADIESDNESDSDSDDEDDVQYSCIIIDDFADQLKDKNIQMQLNKMLIKSRHSCCSFIFTLQSYLYFPRMLRKQLSYATIYKPSIEEFNDIAKELLSFKFDDAIQLFNYVFDEPFNHLDIDLKGNHIYKNFNLLEIKK
jgi:hypothetical protein